MTLEYLDQIRKSSQTHDYETVAKKFYLSYPTKIFVGYEDVEFEIRNELCNYFAVPMSTIAMVGSAKLGFSIVKQTPFNPEDSDLDIAIIDARLFAKYLEISLNVSKGYASNKFPQKDGASTKSKYLEYLGRGIFRPDLMPYCKERQELFSFLNILSIRFRPYAKKISVGIYISENTFIHKQKSLVSTVERNFGVIK